MSQLGPFKVGDNVINTCDFYVPLGNGCSGRELVTPECMSLGELQQMHSNVLILPAHTLFNIQQISKVTFRHEGGYASSFKIDFEALDGKQRGRTFDASEVFMKWQPNYAVPPGGFSVFIEKVNP